MERRHGDGVHTHVRAPSPLSHTLHGFPQSLTHSIDHSPPRSLEKPCIQRAQSAIFSPLNTYPVFSTESAELALYHSFVETEIVATGYGSQTDVAASLDKLLVLSSAFGLENEVTPVQAWQQLCGYLEGHSRGLRELAGALLEHVRCYGLVE